MVFTPLKKMLLPCIYLYLVWRDVLPTVFHYIMMTPGVAEYS